MTAPTTHPSIDLNADLGEGGADDAALMRLISSANIACGGHAGDGESMRVAVDAALGAGVAVGAHPGYDDRDHFGRRALDLPAVQVEAMLTRQLERLWNIHPRIHHVKPHGALYHQANANPDLAAAVVSAILQVAGSGTILYAPPCGALADAAAAAGIGHCAEGFIDRGYLADGTLAPRGTPGAVMDAPEMALAQALDITLRQCVQSIDGVSIPLPARTLCVHGDTPRARQHLQVVRLALEHAGIAIASPAVTP